MSVGSYNLFLCNRLLRRQSRSEGAIVHEGVLEFLYTLLGATILTPFFSLQNYNNFNSYHIVQGHYASSNALR